MDHGQANSSVCVVQAAQSHTPCTSQVADLVGLTTAVLNANNIRGCKEQELLAVLQVRDSEECVMLSAQDGTDLVYIM